MIRQPLGPIFLIALLATAVAASAQNLLWPPPTWHWQNDHFDQVGLRHPSFAMQQMSLPLRCAAGLAAHAALHDYDDAAQSERRRFEPFVTHDSAQTPLLLAGLGLAGRSQALPPDLASERNFIAAHSRFGVRSFLEISPSPPLALVNVMRVDLGVSDEPEYLGKRWRNITGLTELAYARFDKGKYSVKLGRDYVKWGRGFDASLLLSDYSRALDHLHFQFDLPRLRFVYLAAQLDPWRLPDSLAQALRTEFASRSLAAGRLEVEILPQRLRLAFSQMALSGGPHRRFEWLMLNPLLLYHGEQLNGDLDANTAIAFDALFLPRAGIEIYGQWLIDDFQIENVDSTDLEPTEWGMLVGGRVADPFGLRGVIMGLEYTRVANRTYKTKRDWEKFLHRQQPLAHFLGNDFDRWLAHAGTRAGRLWLQLVFEYRRRGEGRISTAFDQPWLDVPAGQPYQEKFPSGIVARSLHLRGQARWHPTSHLMVSLLAIFSHSKNFRHQPDYHLDEKRIAVGLEWTRSLTLSR